MGEELEEKLRRHADYLDAHGATCDAPAHFAKDAALAREAASAIAKLRAVLSAVLVVEKAEPTGAKDNG